MEKIFKIENQKISFPESSIRKYHLLGVCHFPDGRQHETILYVRDDGQILDPTDLSIVFPETMYNEDGEKIEVHQEFFMMDCINGVEYSNKIYLCDFIEE